MKELDVKLPCLKKAKYEPASLMSYVAGNHIFYVSASYQGKLVSSFYAQESLVTSRPIKRSLIRILLLTMGLYSTNNPICYQTLEQRYPY